MLELNRREDDLSVLCGNLVIVCFPNSLKDGLWDGDLVLACSFGQHVNGSLEESKDKRKFDFGRIFNSVIVC